MADNLYRRGKTWWARFQVAGIEYRRSLRTTDRPEARKRLGIRKEEVGHARFYGGARVDWKAAVVRYLEEVLPALKPSTGKRYKVSFRMVGEHLEGKFLDSMTGRDIAALVGARRKAGATNATIRRDLTAVSRVFAAGRGWGACEHNPARDYDRGMIRERRDPIALPSDKDVKRAIGLAPTPLFGKIMAFAVQTGLRQSEILALAWPQVDLQRKAITVARSKTDRARVVPLTGPVTDSAVGTLTGTAKRRGQPLVFGQADGEPYKNLPSVFAAWRKVNAVPFRFHDLRHKFAVSYLHAGGGIYDLQRILGHASIKTTELYLDFLTPEERHRAMMGTTTQKPAQP